MASSSSSSKTFLLFSVLSIAILLLIYSDVAHARNLAETNVKAAQQNEDPYNYTNNNHMGNNPPQHPVGYGDLDPVSPP
ncbi:hypothetical protein DsansV1_C16g0140381 [Dioscorea sansibarensis]